MSRHRSQRSQRVNRWRIDCRESSLVERQDVDRGQHSGTVLGSSTVSDLRCRRGARRFAGFAAGRPSARGDLRRHRDATSVSPIGELARSRRTDRPTVPSATLIARPMRRVVSCQRLKQESASRARHGHSVRSVRRRIATRHAPLATRAVDATPQTLAFRGCNTASTRPLVLTGHDREGGS